MKMVVVEQNWDLLQLLSSTLIFVPFTFLVSSVAVQNITSKKNDAHSIVMARKSSSKAAMALSAQPSLLQLFLLFSLLLHSLKVVGS